MSGWHTFWTWALLIGLSFFTLVVIVVTIGGLRDIRDMLRSLKAGHDVLRGTPIVPRERGFEPVLDVQDNKENPR